MPLDLRLSFRHEEAPGLGYPARVSPLDGSDEPPMKKRLIAACLFGGLTAAAVAQDAERGRKLFADTRGATGKPVGDCIACHANGDALRGMIENRGGNPKDERFIRAVLQKSIEGSVPGAANAKAQYRGVLTAKDIDDLSAYIAKARAT
jgi:mono/diheme cytochrome c family protein